MNKASFLSLVRQASRISDQEVEELEKLIVNFPYCQTAHLLIAKAAYDKGSMLSNQKLKKAAIYAANRQLLKKLIYTSDATVALQPVAPETVPEPVTTQALIQAEPETVSQTQASKSFVEAAVETETLSEPVEKVVLPETVLAEKPEDLLQETSVLESLTETQKTAFEPEVTAEIQAKTEEQEETNKAEIVAATDYEDAAIAEEILEEGYLPQSEAAFLAISETEETFAENEITASQPLTEAAEIAQGTAAETTLETGISEEKTTVSEEIHAVIEPETVSDSTEKVEAPLVEVAQETSDFEEVTLAEEVEIAEAFEHAEITPEFKEPEFAETEIEPVVDYEETAAIEETATSSAAELPAEQPIAESQTPVLNDELLHETLANFDQYLFKPEKEVPELHPTEDVKVVNPENEIQAIYHNDSIGYWMNSSRMGESLEFKNDLTTPQPHDFHPELIWEYNKTHELHKEIKPAPSKLSHQLDIIDQFLKLTPRLKTMANAKVKPEAQEDLSSKSSKINKNLASENFANILVQQGKIKKAIKIYEHLILKIPEKKAYFVSQIEKLQNPE